LSLFHNVTFPVNSYLFNYFKVILDTGCSMTEPQNVLNCLYRDQICSRFQVSDNPRTAEAASLIERETLTL
jgi:hypothetical protein